MGDKFCTSCGATRSDNQKFCVSCGSYLEITLPAMSHVIADDSRNFVESDILKIKNTEGSKEWYETGWAWFWLIVVWPVGLYAFIKRAELESQKYWWIAVGVLLLIMFFDSDNSSSLSEKLTSELTYSSSSVVAIKKGSVFCLSEDQLDDQSKLLDLGIMELADGCSITYLDIDGDIIKVSSGVRGVRGRRNDIVYWVFSESLIKSKGNYNI